MYIGNYLSRFVEKGMLRKVGRGLYTSTSSSATEHLSLVEAAYRVPNGIICLLSALQFHEFTTQAPHQVWMTIDVKAWAPRITSPAIRFVRMSGTALHFGVKEYPVHGGTLKIYTPAKTVADCFKFGNKIGMDVALEALRESRRLKRASMDELWAAAKVCRVANTFILKGALLFELWTRERYRATRDADFLAKGDNSPDRFVEIFQEISTTDVEADGCALTRRL